jgi:hypothetical protein
LGLTELRFTQYQRAAFGAELAAKGFVLAARALLLGLL